MISLLKLIELLWPITYLAGLVVALLYYRKFGKPVFILLLVYFCLGIYTCTISQYVNRRISSSSTSQISQELIEKYEAYQKDEAELHARHFGTRPTGLRPSVKKVHFPYGQIILVVALFLLGKREKGALNN